MTENTAPARCTEVEYNMARNAGLLVVTTADEVAIHKFAEAIRSTTATSVDRFAAATYPLLEWINHRGEREAVSVAELQREVRGLKTAKHLPDWIAIADRLPEDDTDVLLCMPDGSRLVGYRSFYDAGYWSPEPSGHYWYHGKDKPLDWDEPTHWMLIPQAPALATNPEQSA